MSAELLRKINNLVAIGTVTESKSSKGLSLARVKILERVTDFLPVMQISNSFKRHASPVMVGEQVVVLHPFGEGDSGIVIGSIFNTSQKEPDGYSDSKEVTAYVDGTVISYDAKSKTMEITAVGDIRIVCKNAHLSADSVTIVSETTHNGNVSINGNLSVSGNISDSKGDLTGHTHSTTDGATALPR